MRKWKPAPPAAAEAFAAATAGLPGIQPRKMFGYACVFVRGKMMAGLHEAGLIVRLPEVEREALLRTGAVPFEPTPGRRMREYVVAPATLLADVPDLRRWLERSRAYTVKVAAAAARRAKVPAKASPRAPRRAKPVPKRRIRKTARKTARR
jgi:TfoX/Sxy family transcriptional regulator of competence genes